MWLNVAALGGDMPWIGGGNTLTAFDEMYSTLLPSSEKCIAHCKQDINYIIPQLTTFCCQLWFQSYSILIYHIP
jgi:hypothetical protein